MNATSAFKPGQFAPWLGHDVALQDVDVVESVLRFGIDDMCRQYKVYGRVYGVDGAEGDMIEQACVVFSEPSSCIFAQNPSSPHFQSTNFKSFQNLMQSALYTSDPCQLCQFIFSLLKSKYTSRVSKVK